MPGLTAVARGPGPEDQDFLGSRQAGEFVGDDGVGPESDQGELGEGFGGRVVGVGADQAVAAQVALDKDAGVGEPVDLFLDALLGDGAFGAAQDAGDLGQVVFGGRVSEQQGEDLALKGGTEDRHQSRRNGTHNRDIRPLNDDCHYFGDN